MGRLQRRQRLRAVQKLAGEIELTGLPLPLHMEHMGALAASLTQILGRSSDSQRAGRAARFIHAVVEKSSARHRSAAGEIACRKGCAFCCKNYVSATPPLIFAVADALRANLNPAAGGRIRAAEKLTRGLTLTVRRAGHQPCALLLDDVCTVYAARPLACRTFVSTNLAACEQWAPEIPVPEVSKRIRSACAQALLAAMRAHGLPLHSYELNHAVVLALDEPDAERRWLGGEDVFAPVARDDSADGILQSDRMRLLDMISAVARGEEWPR